MNANDLKHAHDTAQGLVNVLQALNGAGTAVESLLLLPLIERAARIKSDLGALYEAQAQAGESYATPMDEAARRAALSALDMAIEGGPADMLEDLQRARSVLGGDDPWHLFSCEAEDVDGCYTIVCSAQSGSALKAEELARAAVLDDLGPAAEIASLERIGTTDADVWVKSGPQ